MSGPMIGVRVSVHTTWTKCGLTGSTARLGSVWLFVVMSLTRTFAEKLAPPLIDFEKYMSFVQPRVLVQAMETLFTGSRASPGTAGATFPLYSLPQCGLCHGKPASQERV